MYVHVIWIPAIPAGMTSMNKLVYMESSKNDRVRGAFGIEGAGFVSSHH